MSGRDANQLAKPACLHPLPDGRRCLECETCQGQAVELGVGPSVWAERDANQHGQEDVKRRAFDLSGTIANGLSFDCSDEPCGECDGCQAHAALGKLMALVEWGEVFDCA